MASFYVDTGYWDALYTEEDFAYLASWGVKKKLKPRVLVAKYGDGYEQRLGDGINTKPQKWDVMFKSRTPAEATEIMAYLDAMGAVVPFNWTNLDGVAIRVVCREWERTYDGLNLNGVTGIFEQVFE